MPPEIGREYTRMRDHLPDANRLAPEKIIPESRTAIHNIRRSMEFLKQYCETIPFADQAAEILFFKVIKPHFHAHLIFWTTVFEIELQRPVGGRRREVKFFKKKLDQLYQFFKANAEFYSYYRSGQNDRDPAYFMRNAKLTPYTVNSYNVNADPGFSSGHDYLVAKLIANEMIKPYLSHALASIPKSTSSDGAPSDFPRLRWTASKAALVELIYALQSGGVFNDGHAVIKEIATTFQTQFDVDIVNFYHTFNEIRLRKKNRTALLDQLREKVLQKMDALDGSR
jgi:RteC protein